MKLSGRPPGPPPRKPRPQRTGSPPALGVGSPPAQSFAAPQLSFGAPLTRVASIESFRLARPGQRRAHFLPLSTGVEIEVEAHRVITFGSREAQTFTAPQLTFGAPLTRPAFIESFSLARPQPAPGPRSTAFHRGRK